MRAASFREVPSGGYPHNSNKALPVPRTFLKLPFGIAFKAAANSSDGPCRGFVLFKDEM